MLQSAVIASISTCRDSAKRRRREFDAAGVMENRSHDVAGLRDLEAYKVR